MNEALIDTTGHVPSRLMAILADEDVQQSMHWLPDGKAFEISKPAVFVKTTLKKHFKGVQFFSFHRSLIHWGFEWTGDKISGRYHKYTFWSPLFLRDQPELCNSMHRITTRKSGKAQTLANETTLFMSMSVMRGPMSQPNANQELQLNPLQVNFIPPAFMMPMMPIQPVWPMPQFFAAYQQPSCVIKPPGNAVSTKHKQHRKQGTQKQSKLLRPLLPESPSKQEISQQLKLMQSVKRNEKTETLQKNVSKDELVAAVAIATLGMLDG